MGAHQPVFRLVQHDPDRRHAVLHLPCHGGLRAVGRQWRLGGGQHPRMPRDHAGVGWRLFRRHRRPLATADLRLPVSVRTVLAPDRGLRAAVRRHRAGAVLSGVPAPDAGDHGALPVHRLLSDLGRHDPDPDHCHSGFCRRLSGLQPSDQHILRCRFLRRRGGGLRGVVAGRPRLCRLARIPRARCGGQPRLGGVHAEPDPRHGLRRCRCRWASFWRWGGNRTCRWSRASAWCSSNSCAACR